MAQRMDIQFCWGCRQFYRAEDYTDHLRGCHLFQAMPLNTQQSILNKFCYQKHVHELTELNEVYQQIVANNAIPPALCLKCVSPEEHLVNNCSKPSSREVYKEKAEPIGAAALRVFSAWQDAEYTRKFEEVDARLAQDLANRPQLSEAYIAQWISRGYRQYINSAHGGQIHRIVLAFNEKERLAAEREKEMKTTKEFIRYKMSGAVDPEFEQATFPAV